LGGSEHAPLHEGIRVDADREHDVAVEGAAEEPARVDVCEVASNRNAPAIAGTGTAFTAAS
jgi:hypothetical protein